MNIIIVGDGKVGYALADQLNQEGHSITVIDNKLDKLNNTMDQLDVIGVLGNGASLDVQIEAGVPDADLLIAATSADELNMICCFTAKSLGAKRTIARVRNPEYSAQLNLFKEQFGLSMVINPELEAAREISRVLKFPQATKVETFSKGRVELVEVKIQEDAPLVGKKLMEMPSVISAKVLICAVERCHEVIIPKGGFVLKAGDRIHVTGESRQIAAFLGQLGGLKRKLRSIMLVGGGRIAYNLVRMLDEKVFRVTIIEKSQERCDALCGLLPHASIIHGDGSDTEVLESEGIAGVDAFVALTNMDEENLIMSMVASQMSVPKIITKTGRFNNLEIMEKLGIDTVINPKMTVANQTIQYVRAVQNSVDMSNINTLHKIVNGRAEAVEFTAGEDTYNLGVPLEKLALRRNLLLALIVRGDKVIIPAGKDSIRSGDRVVVLTNEYKFVHLNDIFQADSSEVEAVEYEGTLYL